VIGSRPDVRERTEAERAEPPVRGDEASTLRRVLLWIVLIGAGGLLLELLLIEHFESLSQFVPLVLLVVVLGLSGWLMVRQSRVAVRIFQAVMLLCVAAGVLGVYLHYAGNVEFELEREPLRHGLDLFWEAIRGATPALAPGALSQLGLLGLAYSFRHPALRSPPVRASTPNVNASERT
jgi:cation transport ATPase